MGSCCSMINIKCSVLKVFVCSFGHWSVLLWFSTSDYPFVSSCSSLVFGFRLPFCILLFFFGFRLPITPLYPPVLLWFSTSDYPFASSCFSLIFDFRLPLCILLFFFDFRLPNTHLYPQTFPISSWFFFIISSDVVGSNPSGLDAQHYMIKFVSYMRQVSPGAPVFSINKAERHDIAEILLKVALNTIKPFIISI